MLPGGVTTRLCCRWHSVRQPWIRQSRPPSASSGGPPPTRFVPAHKGHCIHYWVLWGILPGCSCVAV
ncbi:hypothetical protein MTO96_011049 [Rhipicephalus appendiculatus]